MEARYDYFRKKYCIEKICVSSANNVLNSIVASWQNLRHYQVVAAFGRTFA